MLWTCERLVQLLDTLGIAFRLHRHEPVHTVAEGEAVRVLLDRGVAEAPGLVYFHPFSGTASLGLSVADLLRFLNHTGHNPLIVDMASQAEATLKPTAG